MLVYAELHAPLGAALAARPPLTLHTQPPLLTRRGGGYVVAGVAAAGLGVVVYLKLVRGWSVSDFFYVTRRGLKQGLESVNKGELSCFTLLQSCCDGL